MKQMSDEETRNKHAQRGRDVHRSRSKRQNGGWGSSLTAKKKKKKKGSKLDLALIKRDEKEERNMCQDCLPCCLVSGCCYETSDGPAQAQCKSELLSSRLF